MKTNLNRRRFLKGAAAGAAAAGGAALIGAPVAGAQSQQGATQLRGTAPPPSARALAAETEPVSVHTDVLTADDPGSDFMVDVVKALGIEYIAANPGSSFRSLHESFINYGGNKNPEWLTCCHEESSIAIADGYFRVSGQPMVAMAHGTVGLQHASMNIYNAFVGRIPVFVILGNALDANARRP
ncbi:MAG: thiamine pyrophosphate-binding protein, partial [Blastocatellia bacterium]